MLKCVNMIISGELMYNKSFKFLSQKMDEGEIINLLKSIYEHSVWVPERLLSQNISEIKTKEQLQLMMQKIVDNSSEKEKLNLIKAHPELGKKLKKQETLTKFSEEEQKSAGLDQCSDEEFEILTKLNHEYRLKFEFPFIIAVRGLSKNQIIDNMKKRVNNSKSKEFEITTLKAEGSKCPVCWKISPHQCERHN